jgi:hypothetical protein
MISDRAGQLAECSNHRLRSDGACHRDERVRWLQNRSSPGDVIDPNSTVLNRSEGLDSDVRSCPSSRQSRSNSINRASLDPEVMPELVEHDVSDLAA